MYFETVIIIGSGTIACECSKELKKLGVKHYAMENNPTAVSIFMMQCKKNKIPVIKKDGLTIEEKLLNISKGNTLIISANNEHIFKTNIFQKNIIIINFHYGLLPDYRGINIPTWVIYNREQYTGATWHYIDSKVDNGSIICQSKYAIKEFDTAYDVTRAVMYDGIRLFQNFIVDFLEKPCKGIQNNSSLCKHIYRRLDLPEKGLLLQNMNPELIERLLRAFDYGSIPYIPRLRLQNGVSERQVLRYRIYKKDKLVAGSEGWESSVKIIKDYYCFELLLQ